MISSTLGLVHTIFALLAIVSGAVVLRLPKGTRWHRTVGHLYVASMTGLIVTALSIYRLFGHFGPFHFAAVVAALTLVGGMWMVLVRPSPGTWLEGHATWMVWSYIGLMAAFVAETATRFAMPLLAPRLPDAAMAIFWTAVGVGTFAVTTAGWWLVKTRLPGAIAATPGAMRRERRELREGDPAATDAAVGGTGAGT